MCLGGPLDADGRHAALPLLKREADPLTLIQLAQPRMLHRADMHENIIAAGIRRNETIAFSWIEPFDHAGLRGGGLSSFVFL